MPRLKTILVIMALFLVSFPIYKPLFDPGFFPVHDDMQVARVYEMANALRDGQFPVRIISNFGYGYHYPLFNFYAPLPYYIGAFFNLVGFSPLVATKIMLFLPNFLSLVFMFALVKTITKKNSLAFLAAVLYAYFPYRAADNYVRGVTGEIYVMMFLPLLVLGLYEICKRQINDNKFWKFGFGNWKLVFSLSGILLSHNIYAYLVCLGLAMFSALYSAVGIIKKDKSFLSNISRLIFNSFLSLGLTAFFWLPAFVENKFTHLEKISQAGYYFGNFFLPLKELWQSDWGYGGAAGGMTFMIGKIHLLLFVFAAIISVLTWLKEKEINYFSLFFLFTAVLSTFLTNQRSFFLWNTVPMLNLTQYPMRFIFFIDFSLIIFVILSFSKIKIPKTLLISLVILISFLVIFKNQGMFKSKYNYDFTEKYLSPEYIRWETSEMADEYLPKEFAIPIEKNETAGSEVQTDKPIDSQIFVNKSDELIARVNNVKEKTIVSFPVTNFPGWKMYANGLEKQIKTKTKYNLISGVFQKGDYIVKLKFENTHVRSLGNLISFISLIGLISITVSSKISYGRKF